MLTLGLDRDAAEAIAAMQYGASSDKMRPILTGVEISWAAPLDGRLEVTLASTTSYILGVRTLRFTREKGTAGDTIDRGAWTAGDDADTDVAPGHILAPAKELAKAIKAALPPKRKNGPQPWLWLDIEPSTNDARMPHERGPGSVTVRTVEGAATLKGLDGNFPTWRKLIPDDNHVVNVVEDEGAVLPAINAGYLIDILRMANLGHAAHIPLRQSLIKMPGKAMHLQPVVYRQVWESATIPTTLLALQMPVRL